MAETLHTINSNTAAGRVILLAAVAAAVALSWFGVRWQVANMLAELTAPTQDNSLEVAEAAVSLSPRDPLPRWLLATKLKEDFTPESIDASVRSFEEAVRRSPNDFRWWIELGRAYEQAERAEDAERAFLRAVELAPTYTFPQWQIGNFYLRQDRVDEAFAYLTRATEKSHIYREQVFALAWDYFDKDPARVEQLAADTPEVRVTLASFYAKRGAAADALRVWNTIPESVRERNQNVLRTMTQWLYEKRMFRETLQFARQSGIDPAVETEAVSNPGFEEFFADAEGSLFGWKINRGDGKLEINTDSSVRAEGQRSLKLNFRGFSRPDLDNVNQLIAVTPGAAYRMTFMLRVENLRSSGTPVVVIVDAKKDALLARTDPFPTGSRDWQPVSVEFVVPEGSDGISVRTNREQCGEPCPINGIVWYDAFRLERL